MKNFATLSMACLICICLNAQTQADVYIEEAQIFLTNKQYKEAQLSLQDAINEINMLIAAQIAESMPNEINGLIADGDANNSGAMGMMGGGFQITKTYRHPTVDGNDAEVMIMGNSPMLSAMTMYLTNPTMMGPDYKSIRIGTQRAIMKSEMNGDMRSTEVQIPLSQTLITINMYGFANEAAEIDFMNKLGIDKVKLALGE